MKQNLIAVHALSFNDDLFFGQTGESENFNSYSRRYFSLTPWIKSLAQRLAAKIISFADSLLLDVATNS